MSESIIDFMRKSLPLTLLPLYFLLGGCGHYGPLYHPENASKYVHTPTKTQIPTTAASAKQIEDYGEIDALTIPSIPESEPANNVY